MKVFHIAALALSATTAAAAVKKVKATTECSHTTCEMINRTTAIGVHEVMVSFCSARRLAASPPRRLLAELRLAAHVHGGHGGADGFAHGRADQRADDRARDHTHVRPDGFANGRADHRADRHANRLAT